MTTHGQNEQESVVKLFKQLIREANEAGSDNVGVNVSDLEKLVQKSERKSIGYMIGEFTGLLILFSALLGLIFLVKTLIGGIL